MATNRMTNIIEKKRERHELTNEDIEYLVRFVSSVSTNNATTEPYQIGAMVMALYLNGLNERETRSLTSCMTNSGYRFTWPEHWQHLVVDKHSTGGVGDKISLVLAPALAALGLKVPMISGRSLGHTGGTLDKLESIPGFRTELSIREIRKAVEEIGCCIAGQTSDIVPADRILYHCRDLTATVNSLPLVAASIVSKKLAEGTNALVYDVKYGKGALFKSVEDGLEVAKALVTASSVKAKCSALVTRMNSPIGNQVGNSLEILESVECLRGGGPDDVVELVEALGAELLYLSDQVSDVREGKEKISSVLNNGKALRKFYSMILNQGTSKEVADQLCFGEAVSTMPKTEFTTEIAYLGPEGYINEINSETIAQTTRKEMCKTKIPCLASGITLMKHVGDFLKSGDAWLRIHHQTPLDEDTFGVLEKAIVVGHSNKGSRKRLLYKVTFVEERTVISHIDEEPEYKFDSNSFQSR